MVGPLLSIGGQKAHGFHQKHLNLYCEDEQGTYGVWNDLGVSNS